MSKGRTKLKSPSKSDGKKKMTEEPPTHNPASAPSGNQESKSVCGWELQQSIWKTESLIRKIQTKGERVKGRPRRLETLDLPRAAEKAAFQGERRTQMEGLRGEGAVVTQVLLSEDGGAGGRRRGPLTAPG